MTGREGESGVGATRIGNATGNSRAFAGIAAQGSEAPGPTGCPGLEGEGGQLMPWCCGGVTAMQGRRGNLVGGRPPRKGIRREQRAAVFASAGAGDALELTGREDAGR